MSEEHAMSLHEVEQLSWYDLNAYIGIPYFHEGGLRATDRLADLCGIGSETRVLVVGCGTGYSACYLARTRGCQIDGFDIAENMVDRAKARANAEGVADRVSFQVADAHRTPFEDVQYDVVLTEVVSMFLDRDRAFRECVRVLQPGGYLGIDELYKEDIIPESSRVKIDEAEGIYAEATGLPFAALASSAWQQEFRRVGLIDIQSERVNYTESLRERARSVGGWRKLLGMIGRGFLLMARSREVRRKMLIEARFKRVIMRDKSTRQYIGALLCVGRKMGK